MTAQGLACVRGAISLIFVNLAADPCGVDVATAGLGGYLSGSHRNVSVAGAAEVSALVAVGVSDAATAQDQVADLPLMRRLIADWLDLDLCQPRACDDFVYFGVAVQELVAMPQRPNVVPGLGSTLGANSARLPGVVADGARGVLPVAGGRAGHG